MTREAYEEKQQANREKQQAWRTRQKKNGMKVSQTSVPDYMHKDMANIGAIMRHVHELDIDRAELFVKGMRLRTANVLYIKAAETVLFKKRGNACHISKLRDSEFQRKMREWRQMVEEADMVSRQEYEKSAKLFEEHDQHVRNIWNGVE